MKSVANRRQRRQHLQKGAPEAFSAKSEVTQSSGRSLKRALDKASPAVQRIYADCIKQIRIVCAREVDEPIEIKVFQRNDVERKQVADAAKLLRHTANGWKVRMSTLKTKGASRVYVITYFHNQ